MDHDRVLVALILGVREYVRQQLLIAELRQRPPERLDPGGAAGHVVPPGQVAWDGGCPEASRGEWLRGQAESGVVGSQVVIEARVALVQEEQVLALHAEDQGFSVDGPRA